MIFVSRQIFFFLFVPEEFIRRRKKKVFFSHSSPPPWMNVMNYHKNANMLSGIVTKYGPSTQHYHDWQLLLSEKRKIDFPYKIQFHLMHKSFAFTYSINISFSSYCHVDSHKRNEKKKNSPRVATSRSIPKYLQHLHALQGWFDLQMKVVSCFKCSHFPEELVLFFFLPFAPHSFHTFSFCQVNKASRMRSLLTKLSQIIELSWLWVIWEQNGMEGGKSGKISCLSMKLIFSFFSLSYDVKM